MKQWVIATHNKKKWQEFQGLFSAFSDSLELSNLADHAIESPVEDGLTFVENALIKARVAADKTGLPSLADDSGLVVPAFNGEPGLYSARYAFEGATDSQNNIALMSKMNKAGLKATPAYYHCTLVFLRHKDDPDPVIAQGYWHGEIQTRLLGNLGFGYDPMFFPGPDFTLSAAMLEPKQKAHLSHRGIAMDALLQALLPEMKL